MKARWLLVILAVALSACSGKNTRTDELTEREYYEEARSALENKNFMIAVERLGQLESRYPYGRYAEQAQLEMIYAHYQMHDYDSVLASTERFIRLNPLHDQVDYAYYMRALATYEMGFPFAERRFESDVMRRDPTPMRDAFRYFSELLVRFPDSPYTADAYARMVFIKERLATHEINVARFLMKRHAFVAAANRASTVVVNFQKTDSVPEALAIQVEAYRLLNMKHEANQALELLKLNYPDYRQFKNGEFVDSGLAMTDRRSFWNIVSFGVAD